MSFRRKIILFSALTAVVLVFVLPVFARMELALFDMRVRMVRTLRGNLAASDSVLMLGKTEVTLNKFPEWGEEQDERLHELVSPIARSVWIAPHFEGEFWKTRGEEWRTPYFDLEPDFDGTVRRVELATEESVSPALRLYAAHKGVPLGNIVVGPDSIQLGNETLPRYLVVDFPSNSDNLDTGVSSVLLEPLSLHLLVDEKDDIGRGRQERLLKKIDNSLLLLVEHTQEARTRVDTPMGDLEQHQITFSAVDTLISGWRLKETPKPFAFLLALAFCGLAAWLAVSTGSFTVTMVIWGVLAYGYWQVAVRLFAQGYSIPVAPVLAGSLITIALVAAVLQVRAFRIMKQLVGEDRAADAARGEIDLGGTERPVTILFTNLPKSIQALEQTDPEESIRARNRYGATLTEGVRRNEGRVLDYQGDFQMAGFCVEKVDPDHALNAVRAGLELCRSLKKQYPEENIHCGVCTGPAAVGYVGSPTSKELAAIGDTTNVAARLLGAAMKQKVSVLISETTYALCSQHLVAEKLPAVSLKGKSSLVEVYSVEDVE